MADEALARLCGLDDPTRRRLFELVTSAPAPVSREQAATALGLDRSTAAYHLDKLVEHGLLATSFARPEGRGGPGAGRPAKHYERAGGELTVSVPPRDYRLLADILARAVAQDRTGVVQRAVEAVAATVGGELADETGGRDLTAFLEAAGFAPFPDGEVVRLRNCPFHLLAQEHTELVCRTNLALLGAAAARISPGAEAHLDPAPTRCCVAFTT